MWPVMTLTLLLQLTDDEQLFAVRTEPHITPQEQAVESPATVPADTDIQWPAEMC